ncbi:hypothetical protein IAU60_005586 [Kwoniella sp. DSM 27419]
MSQADPSPETFAAASAAPVPEPMVIDGKAEAAGQEPEQVSVPLPSADASAGSVAKPAQPNKRRKNAADDAPLEPLSEVMLRRMTRIREGDTVLLRLPSDAIKSVVIQKQGLVHLGKYGSFPAAQLLGLHYDITYEIIAAGPSSVAGSSAPTPVASTSAEEEATSGKKGKGKGKGKDSGANNSLAWRNVLRPLRRPPIVEAVIDDITETNEFINDVQGMEKVTLSSDEINALRAEGYSAEEIIQKQIQAHEKFGLKTEFSKEKWRRRKEKKFYQTVHPLSPSIPNILSHYSERAPASILNLRTDTISQLLNLANVRPGGRYMVVDDTSGLVTAAVLERMGGEGRIMLFTDSDSPPAWGILQTMNFGERELECVKWLNWMEADEDYQRPPPPVEDGPVNPVKAAQRLRKHNHQVADLNATRDELHQGGWDGLILATSLSPISIISRLTRYLLGSSPIVAYSPYIQVLAELLNWSKKDPNYLNDTVSESWERTYQVLPGRTHPMMNTSATGGYLWSAIRVHPAKFQPDSHQRFKRRKTTKPAVATTEAAADQAGEAPEAAREETDKDEVEDALNKEAADAL